MDLPRLLDRGRDDGATMTTGQYLARVRRAHPLTQAQLAKALGVTRGFVSAVELDHAPLPRDRWAAAIAALPGLQRAKLDEYAADRVAELAAMAVARRER